jgi:hypothetical protein
MSANAQAHAYTRAQLDARDVDDQLPAVDFVALRYHTIDGVEHAGGETYTLATTAGIASTLVACQFADFVGATPAPIATGAIAGSPGTWTPSGATPPADLAAMTGIAAAPSDVWTTGQHMILGDASHTYWNGAAWITGDAAARAPAKR